MCEMADTQNQPRPRRSFLGYILPFLSTILIAAMALSFFLRATVNWANVDPQWVMIGIATLSLLIWMLAESQVEKQLSLARTGLTTQAIVDEAHRDWGRDNRGWVKYHFTVTETGHVIEGKSTVSQDDILVLTEGSAADVFYDADEPTKNILALSMWAVTWVD
jgi:hypothetical protein